MIYLNNRGKFRRYCLQIISFVGKRKPHHKTLIDENKNVKNKASQEFVSFLVLKFFIYLSNTQSFQVFTMANDKVHFIFRTANIQYNEQSGRKIHLCHEDDVCRGSSNFHPSYASPFTCCYCIQWQSIPAFLPQLIIYTAEVSPILLQMVEIEKLSRVKLREFVVLLISSRI